MITESTAACQAYETDFVMPSKQIVENRRKGTPLLSEAIDELKAAAMRASVAFVAHCVADLGIGGRQPPRLDPLIPIQEAARTLAVSVGTVKNLIADGDIPIKRVKGALRLRTSDVQAYIASQEE